ncbi:MAG: sensor histidine kinase [Chitinivibrionales bacterium]
MKKYLALSLLLVSAVFVSVILLTTSFFSNSEGIVEKKQRNTMLNTAEVIHKALDRGLVTQGFTADRMLEIFSASFSFEKILLIDSSMIVSGSSTRFVEAGEDASPYILKPGLFKEAIASMEPCYSSTVVIDDVPFMAVYYPFQKGNKTYVFEISAGNRHFSQLEGLQMQIKVMIGVLITVFVILIGFLVFLSIKAGKAAQKAFEHEQMAFLGQTSAQLAHELKNPLAIIKSSADLIQKKYDSDKNDKCISYIKDESMHMSEIINQILTVSKNAKIEEVEFSPFDILREVRETLVKSYPELEIEIELDRDLTVPYGPQAFKHIASNLMSNSAKALKGRGKIYVKGEQKGKNYHICFQDNGSGIDKAMSSEIFKPFVSGSKKSTGLGLYIVKNLCSKLNWSIELLCAEKGHTVFRITMGGDSWRRS